MVCKKSVKQTWLGKSGSATEQCYCVTLNTALRKNETKMTRVQQKVNKIANAGNDSGNFLCDEDVAAILDVPQENKEI